MHKMEKKVLLYIAQKKKVSLYIDFLFSPSFFYYISSSM